MSSDHEDPIIKHLESCETEFGKFIVLNNDFIGKWMLRGKHFEIECIKPLIEQLSSGDIVIDIGANIGCYTIPLAQAVGPSGHVYAFEPQGVIKEILLQNVIENGLADRVTVLHSAVGHQNTEATMNGRCDRGRVIEYDRDEETNFGGVNLGNGGEEIEMVSLDRFVESLKLKEKGGKRIGMIKIDVEGAERMVFAGAREVIEGDRPVIFYEDNYKKVTKEMIKMFDLDSDIVGMNIKKYLEEINYSGFQKIKENYLCLP